MKENKTGQKKVPFYKKNWFVILSLIFFFPLGLFLMWMYSGWGKIPKVTVTGFIAVFLLIGALSEPQEMPVADTEPEQETAASETENEEPEEVSEQFAEAETEDVVQSAEEPEEKESAAEAKEDTKRDTEAAESNEIEKETEESVEEEEPVTEEETEIEADEPEEVEPAEEESEPENEVPEVIADLHLTDVRNDTTGEWQKAVTADDVNMPDNAMAYYDEHMDEGDTHYIVSFATNTTISLSDTGYTMYVNIMEYQDGEEHDASELGGGMLLKSYAVNTSDGSIEEM